MLPIAAHKIAQPKFSLKLNQLTIYDVNGNLISKRHWQSDEFVLDKNTLKSGFYIVTAQNEGEIQREKIIIP